MFSRDKTASRDYIELRGIVLECRDIDIFQISSFRVFIVKEDNYLTVQYILVKRNVEGPGRFGTLTA